MRKNSRLGEISASGGARGFEAKLGSVDPKPKVRGSSKLLPSGEVVREDVSWNLENTNFKKCLKASKYRVCTVCFSLTVLKAIYF